MQWDNDDRGFSADAALLPQARPGEWGDTIVELFLTVLQSAVGKSSSCSPSWCLPGRFAASSHGPLRFLRPAV